MNELEPRERCRWCGQDHDGMCPHVSRIEYFSDGLIKRVTFRHPGSPKKKRQLAEVSKIDLPLLEPSVTAEQLDAWGVGRGHVMDVILILGKVGPMIRRDLTRQIAAQRDISPASGNVGRTLRRLRENGLISVRYVPSSTSGFSRGNAWFHLSREGAKIYRQATGEEPAPGLPDDAPGDSSQE